MGGHRKGKTDRHMRNGILAVEHVLGDEDQPKAVELRGEGHALSYDANGYPELPACLDRGAEACLRGGCISILFLARAKSEKRVQYRGLCGPVRDGGHDRQCSCTAEDEITLHRALSLHITSHNLEIVLRKGLDK